MTTAETLPYYRVRVEFTNLADGTVTALDAGRVRDLDLSCTPDRDEDVYLDQGTDRLPPPVRSFSLSVTGTVEVPAKGAAVTTTVTRPEDAR